MNRLAIGVLLVLLITVDAVADPGMWMPQQIPVLADELRDLGLQIDPERFADLTDFPLGAIVWLGGCSGTFVSEDGLILTNHHCVYGSLQYNSTAENDLLEEGFYAATRADELHASPNARVHVTTDIEDVTDQILKGLDDVSDLDRAETIDARRKQMVKDCEATDDLRCWVRSFFEGETFLKITATTLRDVRLVYAPALGVGNFGGEVDNWMWPRHTGDFGFYRAYVGPDGEPADYSPDNVPYHPRHHLKISTRDLDPGDLVLLSGYPGRTSRLKTAAEVREAQTWRMPTAVRFRTELSNLLEDQGKGDREVQILNASRIRSLDNYKKKETGVLEAFERGGLLQRKLEDERALNRFIAADPERAVRLQPLQEAFDEFLASETATRERDLVFDWLYSASPLLEQANTLYRLSVERAKDDDDRAEGYQESDWPRIEAGVRRTQRTIHVPSDRAGLRWILEKAVALPAEQRIEPLDAALAATGKPAPDDQIDALLDRLYADVPLTELDTRLSLLEASTAELMERHDPFLDLAAALRELGEKIDETERAREGARYRLRPPLIAAQRDMQQGRLAPDANRTLRVAFGVVKGYSPRDGVTYEPHTTLRGVLAKDTGERPFDSPPRLLEMAEAAEFGPYADPDLGSVPVAFLATESVTNGSSGSSAINAHGEVIGLAFDMNWEGVAADWLVEEDLVRTIHVDSRYMLWIMDAVDGAHRLLAEMGLPVHFAAPEGAPVGTGR